MLHLVVHVQLKKLLRLNLIRKIYIVRTIMIRLSLLYSEASMSHNKLFNKIDEVRVQPVNKIWILFTVVFSSACYYDK